MQRFKGIIIAGIAVLIIFLPGFIAFQRLNIKNISLKRHIETLEQKNKELERELYRLHHDPDYIEKVAREQFNAAGKDEIILDVQR
jgi:cell division protein FtsB